MKDRFHLKLLQIVHQWEYTGIVAMITVSTAFSDVEKNRVNVKRFFDYFNANRPKSTPNVYQKNTHLHTTMRTQNVNFRVCLQFG